jgi:Tol biopolymer transport system component
MTTTAMNRFKLIVNKSLRPFALMVFCLCAATASAQTRYAIYTMDLDGGELKKIAEVKNNRTQSWPRWSPDGRSIVFDCIVRNPDVRIYKVAADGSGKTVNLGPGKMATWSPDGKQILFHVPPRHPSGTKAGVWIMNADGKGRQWLFPGQGPTYSPDGGKISYVSNHEGSDGLYIYDVVEGASKKLPLQGYAQLSGSAAWSADGKQLCFTGIREGNKLELAIVDLDAADKPAKVRLSGDNFAKHATWAPSEKIYLWLKADDGSLQMHAIDPASDAAPEPVKNHAGNMNTDPQISGDGKKIVFSSTRG